MHSLDGILEPDRQLREHRRDLVVIAPALIVGADRHGHERTHDAPLDGLAATEQQVPEATRDHGEHDIVDGATVKRADLLDVHQPGPRPVPPAMRADRAVERARRARGEKRSHVPNLGRPRRLAERRDADRARPTARSATPRRDWPHAAPARERPAQPSSARGQAPSHLRQPSSTHAPCLGARSSGPSPRHRRPCNGAPLRSTPSGRRRAPPQPTSPTAALRDRAAGTSPARPEFAARRRHQAPEVPCAARGTRG